MRTDQMQSRVSVELPLSFVHGLLALTHLMDDGVIAALQYAALSFPEPIPEPAPLPAPRPEIAASKRAATVPHRTKLGAKILGQRIPGHSLSDLFGNCVDVIHELDPTALERLAQIKTHARHYVARRAEQIHLKSPHLETLRTQSGWWISANVSEQQVEKAFRLLAEAANLTFGKDVIFPLSD
jgi:hypothetical protein